MVRNHKHLPLPTAAKHLRPFPNSPWDGHLSVLTCLCLHANHSKAFGAYRKQQVPCCGQ